MPKTIVIGDIHGCYDELQHLLREIGTKPEDRVISVGDVLTKGPKNLRVLRFFQTTGNAEAVLGNHERILLQHSQEEPVSLEPSHFQTIDQLGGEFAGFIEWAARLPHYIDLGSHLVVHAGVRPGRRIEEQTVEDLTELRALDGDKPGSRVGTPWFDRYEGEKKVIFGHWVFAQPLIRENAVGIDTGCVYGGKLTAMLLPEERLVSVPARRAYAKKKE